MTDVLTRGAPPAVRRRRGARQGSVVVAGVVAAAGAAALGLLACVFVVVLGWATDPNSTATPVTLIRAAGQLWVLAHRGQLGVDGDTLHAAPLSLTVLMLVFVGRASAAAARRARARSTAQTLVAGLSVAPPYALALAMAARLSATPGVRPLPVPALSAALVLGTAAALIGATRAAGWKIVSAGWRPEVRAALAGALAILAGALAVGSLLVAMSLAADVDTARSIARSIGREAPGGVALLLVQLCLAPNAAVWGAAYAAGTGFAFGVGTQVAPGGVTLGAAPALPLLAALPASGAPPVFAGVVATLGVIGAAAVAGVVASRRLDGFAREFAPAVMVAAAAIAGALFAVLCWLAAAAGPGRLAELGPDPLTSGAALAQWSLLGGVPAAWLASWWQARHDRATRVSASQ